MPIAPSDIVYRLSVTTGGSGESTASSTALSLGKYASTTPMVDAVANNLFDDVSGDDNANLVVDYRAFTVLNKHATLTWQLPKAWLSAEVASGANIAIGLDPIGVAASTAILGTSIATETDAPAGVVFSSPTTKGTGLAIPNVPAGSGFMVWVRRTAANTAPVNADGATISIQGDTGA